MARKNKAPVPLTGVSIWDMGADLRARVRSGLPALSEALEVAGIIRGHSDHGARCEALGDWVPRLNGDNVIVSISPRLDLMVHFRQKGFVGFTAVEFHAGKRRHRVRVNKVPHIVVKSAVTFKGTPWFNHRELIPIPEERFQPGQLIQLARW